MLSFAFLPVAYSRIAVTDVGTLLPVSFVLVRGDPGVRGRRPQSLAARRARWRASPSASSTPPGWCCCRCSSQGWRACGGTAPRSGTVCSALAAAIGVFFVTNPYVFIDLSSAWHQLHGEAELAGKFKKLGQEQYSGPATTSGASPGGSAGHAAVAVLVGLVVEPRRDRVPRPCS